MFIAIVVKQVKQLRTILEDNMTLFYNKKILHNIKDTLERIYTIK